MAAEYKKHNKELRQNGGIYALSTHLKCLQYIISLYNPLNDK